MSERLTEYQPDEIPEEITRTIYVGYGIGKFNGGRIVVSDYLHDSEDFAVVPILEKELTFHLPKCKIDIKGKMLEVLEAEKQKVLAENHARLQAVQEKIDQLLVLEHKPEGAA